MKLDRNALASAKTSARYCLINRSLGGYELILERTEEVIASSRKLGELTALVEEHGLLLD